jgi:hypothetical protein
VLSKTGRRHLNNPAQIFTLYRMRHIRTDASAHRGLNTGLICLAAQHNHRFFQRGGHQADLFKCVAPRRIGIDDNHVGKRRLYRPLVDLLPVQYTDHIIFSQLQTGFKPCGTIPHIINYQYSLQFNLCILNKYNQLQWHSWLMASS